MNNTRALWMVMLVLAAGCPRPGGGSSSSSTSGGSSGGAPSSSAAASRAPGSSAAGSSSASPASSAAEGPVPLESLCGRLADGTVRATVYVTATLNSADCAPGFASDDEAVLASAGNLARARASQCSPDGGTSFRVVSAIARSQANGRLLYNPQAAGDCSAGGRQYLAQAGGLMSAAMGRAQDGGASPDPSTVIPAVAACLQAVVGLQGPGSNCVNDLECAQGDAGAECIGRSLAGCEGTCVFRGQAGAACGTGHPLCVDGYACSGGTCRLQPHASGVCSWDGGSVTCADSLDCLSGVCTPKGGPDAGCVPFSTPDCADGLICVNSHCQPLGTEGQPCQDYGLLAPTCAPCLTCYAQVNADGGAFNSCRGFAGVGESCANRPCHAALACLAGSCQARARTGQPCTPVPSDERMGGNCLAKDEACVGNPSTCQPRAEIGTPCAANANALPTTGSCNDALDSNVYCLRNYAVDVTGTCRGRAAPGEPCGKVNNLPPACVTGSCSAYSVGAMGRCPYSNAAQGGFCLGTSECGHGLYCAVVSDAGTCQPGGANTMACGAGQPYGTVCAQGRCNGGTCSALLAQGAVCASTSDCGSTLRCAGDDAGHFCVAQLVAGAACRLDQDCQAAHSCYNGECTADVCVAASSTDNCAQPGAVTLSLFFGACVAGGARARRRKR